MNIVHIAKKLKVSPSTVSRALNPKTEKMISEKVRNKIKRYALENAYLPSRSAQELVTGRSHSIGILHSTAFDALFFHEHAHKFYQGLYKALSEHPEYSCKVITLPKNTGFSDANREILSAGVDGLLIMSQVDWLEEDIRKLINKNLSNWKKPIVALSLEPHKPVHSNLVYFSNSTAGNMAMTHLIQSGHKHIGLIYGSKKFPGMMDRFNSYKKTLQNHSIPFRSAYIKQGYFHSHGAYQATLELLNQNKSKITALFCTTDQMAFGTLRAINSLGLRCPQDISVMSIDGLAAGDFTSPRLSSILLPTVEVAYAGTQLLIDMIEGKTKGHSRRIIPSQMLIRESA